MNSPDATTCLSLYRMGRLIRRTEEILIEEYARQEMRCPMHFCIGQEGTPTALSALLRPDDYIVSHYRSHGYYLAKGAPLGEMLAEFHGKATGSNGGFAGSMELAHEEARIYSGAIVGGPAAIAMGVAFALKYRQTPGIAIAVVGDGSLDEGVSYEALNLAALHGVPLLTICENNLYAAHTPEQLRTMSRSITDRVKSFGMSTERFDGMNVVKLHQQLSGSSTRCARAVGRVSLKSRPTGIAVMLGPRTTIGLSTEARKKLPHGANAIRFRCCATKRYGSAYPKRHCAKAKRRLRLKSAEALASARSADFPDFRHSLAQVWSQSYSPIVKEFVRGGAAAFDSRQAETRLKPY